MPELIFESHEASFVTTVVFMLDQFMLDFFNISM